MKKALILEALNAMAANEIKEISENIEKFLGVEVKETKEKTLAEVIAESGLIDIKDGNITYLEEPQADEAGKAVVVINEAKRTAKIFLGKSWILFDLDGKNRHIQRIVAMRLSAKKLEYKNGKMEGVELNQYDEENDVNLYIQERYVKEWSFKDAITTNTIRDAKGEMRELLAAGAKEFLEYRRNGLTVSEKEEEKKK